MLSSGPGLAWGSEEEEPDRVPDFWFYNFSASIGHGKQAVRFRLTHPMTPGHPADPPCLGTILPCDLVALGEFWKSEGPSGQGTCSGMSELHVYIVQRHFKKCKREKLQITTMIC